jgi:hypothetical protein
MRDADDTTTANLPPDLRAIALQRRLTRRFDDLVASTEDLREKLRAFRKAQTDKVLGDRDPRR